MGIKLQGSVEYLYDFDYRAELVVDVFVQDSYLWIMAPLYEFSTTSARFVEVTRVLSSPKNAAYAKTLVDEHNSIFDSPVMQLLRES